MIAIAVALVFAATIAVMLLRRDADARSRLAVAAALLLAAGGYARTGHPFLPAAPPPASRPDLNAHPPFETERQTRLQRFGETGAWLTFADALIRADAPYTAVQALRGAIDARPSSGDVCMGLGNALSMHGQRAGAAATLAFDRARTLAPDSAQPAFFRGLALLETGDARGATRVWQSLAARSLPDPDLDLWIGVAERRAAGQPAE